MKIICLMENTASADNILLEHGFSLYVETTKHKLLIDAGQSSAFAENAKTLGVDLSKVDMAMLSHGHYDHSGGLMKFAQINNTAPIYMQSNAGGEYYHTNDTLEKYIGIDKGILALPQVRLVNGNVRIDAEISVFTGVKGRRHFPSGNYELTVKVEAGNREVKYTASDEGNYRFIQDDFSHEQYVVIEEDGQKILVSGCAHNGILNILDEFKKIYGCDPDMVISGFHLMKDLYSEEDLENIKAIAEELVTIDTTFYTGHCTGLEAFDIMKEIMGDKLHYVHSGEEI